MNEMVNIVPLGSCPKCGHKQFIVIENQLKMYLTNQDGEIIDFNELDYRTSGKCCNCGSIFKMIPTLEGFIPSTRLREILFDYSPHALNASPLDQEIILNPMEVQ